MIVQDGMRRMLEAQEDVFYYVTVMNENYAHPALPAPARADGRSLRGMVSCCGMYLLRGRADAQVQLLGSGTILREVIAAAEALERDHGVAANVWSVTSWTELRWDGMACARRVGRGARGASGRRRQRELGARSASTARPDRSSPRPTT